LQSVQSFIAAVRMSAIYNTRMFHCIAVLLRCSCIVVVRTALFDEKTDRTE